MNEASTDREVRGAADGLRRQRARVGALHDDDARVDAELVRELPVPDVDGDDPRGAALQQAIGEAAGRRPEIEATKAAHVERERVERPRELHAAARDVGVVGAAHLDRSVVRHERAGLVDAVPADEDLSREHEGLRARPRRREPAGHEQVVEALLRHRRVTSLARARAGAERAPALARPSATRGPGRRTRGSLDGHDVALARGAHVRPARAPGRMRDDAAAAGHGRRVEDDVRIERRDLLEVEGLPGRAHREHVRRRPRAAASRR